MYNPSSIPPSTVLAIRRLAESSVPDGERVFEMISKSGISRSYKVTFHNGLGVSVNRNSYLSRFLGWFTRTHSGDTGRELLGEVNTAINTHRASRGIICHESYGVTLGEDIPEFDVHVHIEHLDLEDGEIRRREERINERLVDRSRRDSALAEKVRGILQEECGASEDRIGLSDMIARVLGKMQNLDYETKHSMPGLVEKLYGDLLEDPNIFPSRPPSSPISPRD